jgi:hypothetical protein
MKRILERVIELNGKDKGIIAVRIDRTFQKALYKRSDNQWVCFYVKQNKHRIYEDGRWKLSGDTFEQYPCKVEFGKTAWKGSETIIRKRYQQMNDKKCVFDDTG